MAKYPTPVKSLKLSFPIFVLTFLALASFIALRHLPLWRDMRINCASAADIKLPSGHIVPCNKWFSFPADAPELGFLQVQEGNTYHNLLFQNDVSRDLVSMIMPEGSKPLELVRGGSSGDRTEYWAAPVSLESLR